MLCSLSSHGLPLLSLPCRLCFPLSPICLSLLALVLEDLAQTHGATAAAIVPPALVAPPIVRARVPAPTAASLVVAAALLSPFRTRRLAARRRLVDRCGTATATVRWRLLLQLRRRERLPQPRCEATRVGSHECLQLGGDLRLRLAILDHDEDILREHVVVADHRRQPLAHEAEQPARDCRRQRSRGGGHRAPAMSSPRHRHGVMKAP